MDDKLFEEFQKHLGFEITDEYHNDLQLGELNTNDGYEIYFVGKEDDLHYENDLFYYKPSLDVIIERIKELQSFDDDVVQVGCYDIDDWFDEYDIVDYLNDNLEEEKLIELGLL